MYTADVLRQNDSSLEEYHIYILNEIQSLKTKTQDKFLYLDHVIETYNSDIQRLTNYLNDIKLEMLYVKTDINTFKLDSLNLHKLDISLYKIEADINDLKFKFKDINEIKITQKIDDDIDRNLLEPNDIIMDISSLNLNEQYKEISKYIKKPAIIEDDNGTRMNFTSNKK